MQRRSLQNAITVTYQSTNPITIKATTIPTAIITSILGVMTIAIGK
jgi:hypothetical protein